jgi:predicted nucleotidyltransferase
MRLVILFGSRARGDFTEESDYDVLVVGDEIPGDPRRVPNELYMKIVKMFPKEVDPVFMNTHVFMKKLEQGSPFILQIIEEGRVIKKEEEFWEKALQVYHNMRPSYERRGKEWARIRQ